MIENKIYTIQNKKYKRRSFNMEFYRDMKFLIYRWEEYIKEETGDLKNDIAENSEDLLALLKGVDVEGRKITDKGMKVLKKNITGNEKKAKKLLVSVAELEIATRTAKEMFLIGFTEMKNSFENKVVSNIELLFSTFLCPVNDKGGVNDIDFNPRDESQTIELIEIGMEVLEDFFLSSEKLRKKSLSLSKNLNTTKVMKKSRT